MKQRGAKQFVQSTLISKKFFADTDSMTQQAFGNEAAFRIYNIHNKAVERRSRVVGRRQTK